MARAIAPRPRVLLLDEPLSALDLKLRKAMQLELKQLQRETGITFIFVTHDQDEALTMSDRIAVMSAGELQQLGDARDIYERPENRFVAGFIGDTNLLEVTVKSTTDTEALCTLATGTTVRCDAVAGLLPQHTAHVSIRPERLTLRSAKAHANDLQGIVNDTIYAGTDVQTIVALEGGIDLSVRTQNSHAGNAMMFERGAQVFVDIEQGAARLLVN
jgi:spermidine/putrescine transport system ATP-binding protein